MVEHISSGRLNTKRDSLEAEREKRAQAGDLDCIADTSEKDLESGAKEELTDIQYVFWITAGDDMISHVEDTEANELINELVILTVKEPRTTAVTSQNAFI